MASIDKTSAPQTKEFQVVQSMPNGAGLFTSENLTLASGEVGMISFTIYPATSSELKVDSIFEHTFALKVDTNGPDYLWPFGVELTTEQKKLRIIASYPTFQNTPFINEDFKSPLFKGRCYVIVIENYGSSSHTYYIDYKPYTFGNIVGTIATSTAVLI